MKPFTDQVGNYMPLEDYTDNELYKFLDKNESTEPMILACICSEILRREQYTKEFIEQKKGTVE